MSVTFLEKLFKIGICFWSSNSGNDNNFSMILRGLRGGRGGDFFSFP